MISLLYTPMQAHTFPDPLEEAFRELAERNSATSSSSRLKRKRNNGRPM